MYENSLEVQQPKENEKSGLQLTVNLEKVRSKLVVQGLLSVTLNALKQPVFRKSLFISNN